MLDPVPLPVPLPVPVPLVPVLLPVLEPVPLELPVLLPLMPELPLAPMLSFVLILQVSESIFTSVTLNAPFDMFSVPDEVAVAEEFEPPFSHMPFTVISCPTCAETSWPARLTGPFFVCRTYWLPCDSTQPFSFFSLFVEFVLAVLPFWSVELGPISGGWPAVPG